MTTGEKIYKLRRESNYTQEQLADLLKVTRQAVSRWESDMTLPETDKLKEISKAILENRGQELFSNINKNRKTSINYESWFS